MDNAIQGVFTDASKWTGRYQRNNKRSGLKNLRCFPHCSESHRMRGFCGDPVRFQVQHNTKNCNLFLYAEFAKSGTNPSNLAVGSVVDQTYIQNKIRTKDKPFNPWFDGEVVGSSTHNSTTVNVEFNSKKKGWHYSWVANKHTCDATHILRVYIFEQVTPNSFELLQFCDSKTFTLFCRRRQRQNVVDLPEQIRKQLEVQKQIKQEKISSLKVECTDYTCSHSGLMSPQAAKKRTLKGKIINKQSPKKMKRIKKESIFDQADAAAIFSDSYNSDADNSINVSHPASPNDYDTESALLLNVDDVLWRVMHALLMGKPVPKNDSSDPTALPPASSNPLAADDTFDSMFNDDNLMDLIDQFIPGGGFDSMSFDDNYFSNLNGSTIMPLEQINMNDPISSKNIMNNLVSYFADDSTNFVRSVAQLSASKEFRDDKSCKSKKRMFLDIIQENLNGFLIKFDLSLKQLDLLLRVQGVDDHNKHGVPKTTPCTATKQHWVTSPVAASAPQRQPISTPTNLCDYSYVQKFKQNKLPGTRTVDMTGVWRRDAHTMKVLADIREKVGVPWLVSKLMGSNEEVITIKQDAQHLYVFKGNLMSTGFMKYKLDGKEHSCRDLLAPLMVEHPIQSYQSWINNDTNTVFIIHNFNSCIRLVRQVCVNTVENRLDSIITLEQRETEVSRWQETLSVPAGAASENFSVFEAAQRIQAEFVKYDDALKQFP